MNLRNRVAFHFVSRLFYLIIIFTVLLFISFLIFSFFLNEKKATSSLPISDIVKDTTLENGNLSVKNTSVDYIKKHHLWLQILDENGNEKLSVNKPSSIPSHHAPGQLVSNYIYPAKKGYQLSVWYEKKADKELTWIVGKKFITHSPLLFWANNLWILLILIIGIAVAILFGKRFAAPLLHVVSWIDNLSKGTYREPLVHKGIIHSRNKNGKLRAEFRTYQELMEALRTLTEMLKQNQKEREQLEKTREEWITGVSHDLKTPLSIVKGYTVLLSSKDHQWEIDNIRQFSDTMQERVNYMEQLLEDFSLTFRLKNDALPLNKQSDNIVNMIRETFISLTKLPEAKNKDFEFNTDKEVIVLNGDSTYLKRALENLIANSIKHNPPYTTVKVNIHTEASKQIKIITEDDGIGMEEEVLEHLFDRYYRGTNSSSHSGSGLGMAIARQIILAHDGSIKINTFPNQGTKIIITLPL